MGDKWSSLIDELFGKLMEDTDITQLPGHGKPLNLEINPHEPPEMRMANKLLKDNELAPDWIMESQELDALREKIMQNIKRAIHTNSIRQVLRDEVETYNKRVLSYNLKIPAGVVHKKAIELERELKRA